MSGGDVRIAATARAPRRAAASPLVNPLAIEVLRGLAVADRAQLEQVTHLLLQAVVLFAWWPKSTLAQALQDGDPPRTLVAAVLALGLSLAYRQVRAGAEESLLPGQHALGEWVLATPLGLGRILRGYLLGQLLQSLHAMALAAPLLIVAMSVAPGSWQGLAACSLAMLLLLTVLRLLAALVYAWIGHLDSACYVGVRVLLLLGLVLPAVLLPQMSLLRMTPRLLDSAALAGEHALFAAGHVALILLLTLVLRVRLGQMRRAQEA